MRKLFSWQFMAGLLVLTLISITVLTPMLRPGFFVTDDGDWMVIRLSAFYQNMREGQFPVRYLGRLNNNYGYPVANFLYPGYLYIGSLLHLVGFTFVDSVKILMGGSFIGTVLLVFAWLSRNFGLFPGLCGALSVALSPYLLFDLYKRGSVGEVLGIFAGSLLISLIQRGYFLLIPFATALLVVSHNTVAMIFLSFSIFYLLILKKFNFIAFIMLGLIMSAFFWYPAITERHLVMFDKVTVSNPFEYFASGVNLPLIGTASALSGIVVILWYRVLRPDSDTLTMLIVYGTAIFLASPLSAPLWSLDFFGRLIQFPYRLLSISIISGSWIIGFLIYKTPRTIGFALSVLLFVMLVWQVSPYIYQVIPDSRPEGFYSTNEATTTVADEYNPKWVVHLPSDRAAEKIVFFNGKGTITPLDNSLQRIHADIYAETESIMQINTVYYPGWGVSVNGLPQEIDYSNEYGLIRFPLKTGNHEILAEFRETMPRFIADIISLGGIIVYLGILVYSAKNRAK